MYLNIKHIHGRKEKHVDKCITQGGTEFFLLKISTFGHN